MHQYVNMGICTMVLNSMRMDHAHEVTEWCTTKCRMRSDRPCEENAATGQKEDPGPVGPCWKEAQVMHGEQDAAMDGFQTVLDVRQSSAHYD